LTKTIEKLPYFKQVLVGQFPRRHLIFTGQIAIFKVLKNPLKTFVSVKTFLIDKEKGGIQQIRLRGVRSTDHEVHGCTEPRGRGTINIMGIANCFAF